MKPPIDYTLYLVTDEEVLGGRPVEEAVERAIRGGCTLVQLREKVSSSRDFLDSAARVKRAADRYGVPTIINDRADIAVAVEAAGVHVGQSDLPVAAARRIVGPDRIVGASASNLGEARLAAAEGADYLGVGAMFATGTKSDASLTSMEELRRIRAAVPLPLVVIGGINLETIPLFRGIGIEGVAVVSAILGQDDAERAAREVRRAFSGR